MKDERYNRDLGRGKAYEEWVYRELLRHGFRARPCRTLHEQLTVGENYDGIEIKFDGKWQQYGNLYIETAERPTVRDRFRWSGPFRGDNSRWYWIGDRDVAWCFSIARLRAESPAEVRPDPQHGTKRWRCPPTPTAHGYLLPCNYADTIAERIWDHGTFVTPLAQRSA